MTKQAPTIIKDGYALYLEGQPLTAKYDSLYDIWSLAFIRKKHAIEINENTVQLKKGYEIRKVSNPSV